MLEKPNIPDDLIISNLQQEYGLHVAELTFLPIGADLGSAVYRVVTDDGTAYFLKLRKTFDEIIVEVPSFSNHRAFERSLPHMKQNQNKAGRTSASTR